MSANLDLNTLPQAPTLAISKPSLTVSVRALVEFVLRSGDWGGERDFVSPYRAREGLRGHQWVRQGRPQEYQTEVPLSYPIETAEFVLTVKGRIDGLLATAGSALIEEIKTVLGSWNGVADPLHWAQGKTYAFVYAQQKSLAQIDVQLTYLNLDTNQITPFRQTFSRAELAQFFDEVTAVYLQWTRRHLQWRQLRDQSIRLLAFPFPQYRPGQRALAVAVYRALTRQGKLFAEAPTGIGKTISVIFPALKALSLGQFGILFYLTAKTIGRTIAEQTFADLRRAGLRCRTVTLTAKEKICFNAGQPCEAKSCPFAQGYYDRVKPAVQAALAREALTRTVIEDLARQFQVCPFELSLDAALWADVIIGDYNYVFDPKAYLRRFFDEESGPYAFLIDEAHNLVDRARDMFSSDLARGEILPVKQAIQRELPHCARAVGRLSKHLLALRQGAAADAAGGDHSAVMKELPREILPAMREVLEEAAAWLAQNRPAPFRQCLLELYFRVSGFVRTADLYDERYVTILEAHGEQTRLRLYCLDPSFLIQQALSRGQAVIFFSATLSPLDYFRHILGGDANDAALQLPSPFPPENLCLLVADRTATNLKARASTYDEVARAIASLIRMKSGNYLVYFPSYSYLNQVLARFSAGLSSCRILVQTPNMGEIERETFLAAFHQAPAQTLVGFAVMGGVFGEGIDLAGDRLVGAVIVGVGLPQICLERDLIRAYYQARNGAGFDYSYLYPGMNRVLQAAGRVIRSGTDQGVILLIDTRFAQARYRQLFPPWWRPVRCRGPAAIAEQAERFWQASRTPG